jgi:propionaldehyde dehydrogenase
MEYNENKIAEIVKQVVSELGISPEPRDIAGTDRIGTVLFDTMEESVKAALAAQKRLADMTLTDRALMIDAMRLVSREHAEELAGLSVEETGMGRRDDKVLKIRLAADKTPGTEDLKAAAFTGDRGLTLVEMAPFGVIGAVTPSTNPAPTVINNAISIIAAGNAVVFAPHPAAREVSQKTMLMLNRAIVSAGGPDNLITGMKAPSIEGAQILFSHPDISLLLVTGGPAVVRAAMKTEKKVIAAGPGNPPAVIDESADFENAADSVISGASFDNGILCTAEKEVLLADGAAESILRIMRRDKRVYELSLQQIDRLAEIVIKESGAEPVLDRNYVGKNASVIASAIGLNIDPSVRLLWAEVPEDHVFMHTEQLMPVLPFARTGDIDSTIRKAIRMEGGNRHTAVMHSKNVENLTKMARQSACSIFVKNGPSYMGLGMGEGYATLSIATPTGDGLVKTSNFTRPLRCVLVDNFRIV